jgi:hypothetical protein
MISGRAARTDPTPVPAVASAVMSASGRSRRATAGMRRVDRLRIVEGRRIRFYVDGIGHRFPVTREVTPAVARTLMDRLPVEHRWAATARGAR